MHGARGIAKLVNSVRIKVVAGAEIIGAKEGTAGGFGVIYGAW